MSRGSEIFEKAVKEWYEKSRVANLEFLHLEDPSEVSHLYSPKSSSKVDIHKAVLHNTHNIAVIYSRLVIFSKVSLKNYHEIFELVQEESAKLFKQIQKVHKQQASVLSLLEEHKPLTKKEVVTLVTSIAEQPKLVEQEALRLTTSLEKHLKEVKELLETVQKSITG